MVSLSRFTRKVAQSATWKKGHPSVKFLPVFDQAEVAELLEAGHGFANLGLRNMVTAVMPLYKAKHFPHVNVLKELAAKTQVRLRCVCV